jgi:hypothetical protein
MKSENEREKRSNKRKGKCRVAVRWEGFEGKRGKELVMRETR